MNMAKENKRALLLHQIINEAKSEQKKIINKQLTQLRLNNTTQNVLVIFDSKRAYRDCELNKTTFTYDGQKHSTVYDTDMLDPSYPKILIKKKSGNYIFIGRVLVNVRIARDVNRKGDEQPSYRLQKNIHRNPINLLSQVIENICTLTSYHLKLNVLLANGLIPDNVDSLDHGMVKCKMVF